MTPLELENKINQYRIANINTDFGFKLVLKYWVTPVTWAYFTRLIIALEHNLKSFPNSTISKVSINSFSLTI
jgi:hypothetical protein